MAGAAAAPSTDEHGWSDRRTAAEPPPVPLRLGSHSLTELLDAAWSVITCRPRTVLALSALTVVPAEVLVSLLTRDASRPSDAMSVLLAAFPFVTVNARGDVTGIDWVSLAVLSLAYTLLGAALGRLVAAWYDDSDLTVPEIVGATARRLPALLVAWAVTSVVQLGAIAAGVVPALLAIPLFILVAPVITIEGLGPFRAIGRSAGLVSRRLLSVAGIWLVSLCLERFVNALLVGAPEVLTLLTPDRVDPILRAAGWGLALFVTAPTVAGLAVLLYFDLRVRVEGLDIEIDAATVLPDPAAARSGGTARAR